jgi:hypothetical protein
MECVAFITSALCGSCRAVSFCEFVKQVNVQTGKCGSKKRWVFAGQMSSVKPFYMSGPEDFVILN